MSEISNQTQAANHKLRTKKTSLFLSLLLILFSYNPALAEEKLSCAVIFPLTGIYQTIGQGLKNGLELAKEDFNKEGQVNFILEDDQFQPKNTVTLVNKFISNKKIKCAIVFGSSTGMAVVSILEQHQIPTLVIASNNKVIENKKYIYQFFIPPLNLNEAVVKEINKKGYKNLALISTIHDASMFYKEAFIKSNIPPILVDEELNFGDPEIRAVASKIKFANPDAVYFNLLTPQISILAKLLRQINYKGDFFGWVTFGVPQEIKAAQGTLDGNWYAGLDDSKSGNFKERYLNKFKEDFVAESLYAYDLAKIIIESSSSSTSLIDYIENKKTFSGLLGEYPLVNHAFQLPVKIKVVGKE